MAKQSFWDHPIEKLEEALNLKKQIASLQHRLSTMFGSDEPDELPKAKVGRPRGGRRKFSAETRAKMAASQRTRWTQGNGALAVAKPAKRGKRNMSPEARERIAAAQRARWAKAKGTPSAGAVKTTATRKRVLSPEGRARIVAALKARHAAKRKNG